MHSSGAVARVIADDHREIHRGDDRARCGTAGHADRAGVSPVQEFETCSDLAGFTALRTASATLRTHSVPR